MAERWEYGPKAMTQGGLAVMGASWGLVAPAWSRGWTGPAGCSAAGTAGAAHGLLMQSHEGIYSFHFTAVL